MADQSCFQLINQGVAFPPVLIKLVLNIDVKSSTSTDTSPSRTSASASLTFEAVRFLNGRQELVCVQLPSGSGDGDGTNTNKERDAFVGIIAGKKGLNRRMSIVECCIQVYKRFEEKRYHMNYDKNRSELQLHLEGLQALELVFHFSDNVKRTPVTPAFVLAFEAACSFGKLLEDTLKTSEQAVEDLKQKEKELRQAERKANNLTADLSVEKQRFQRLLSSGGSSLEDALMPRGAGKGGLRRSSVMLDMPMSSASSVDPDSPRKKRKAADAVLTKAGRTAQKETKTGFIDSGEEEDNDDSDVLPKSGKDGRSSTSSSDDVITKAGERHKPSSSGTASSSGPPASSSKEKKNKSKVVGNPTLSAKGSVVSAKSRKTTGFVDNEDEDATASDVEENMNGSKTTA